MALDNHDEQGSPAWWLKTLATAIQDRRVGREDGKLWRRDSIRPQRIRPGIDLLGDHLAGDPPLFGVAEGWREGFREVTRMARLNVAAIIVEAKVNRMPLRDFRTAAADDELGDAKAREIMRANDLRVRGRDTLTNMLGLSDGYMLVTPGNTPDDIPSVTSEDPRECITVHDPLTDQVMVALKFTRDEWNSADLAYLYMRDEDGSVWLHRAKKKGASSIGSNRFRMSKAWEWDGEAERTKADQMPIVRFRNRDGVGEFERHLNTLDRINDQILNRMVIAKIQAFRQRGIKGLPDKETVIEGGVPVTREIDYSDAFIAGPGEMWRLPADAEMWESSTVDVGPIRMAVRDDIEHLFAVTSTPLHLVAPDAASGSAEGASLLREEHVYAVESCRDHADRPLAQVMATCFAYMGDTERANAALIEPMWGPAERFSLPAKADAAQKAKGSLPNEVIQRDIWQYTPSEIQENRKLGGRDLLNGLSDRDPFALVEDDNGDIAADA